MIKRQLSLEEESVTLGIQAYKKQLQETPLSELPSGLLLLKKSIEPLASAIEVFKLPSVGQPKAQRVKKMLSALDMDNHEVSYILIKACMSSLGDKLEDTMVTKVCFRISEMILDHYEYLKFKKLNPGYLKNLEEDQKSATASHRRQVIQLKKKAWGILDTTVSQEDRLALGQVLLDMVIESTGLFALDYQETAVASDRRWYLKPSEDTQDYITHMDSVCEIMNPVALPMIIKPRQWVAPTDGGYLTNTATNKDKIVRTRKKKTVELLQGANLSKVYSAINAIQETPWRVNTELLGVLSELWESGSILGGLPTREKLELPTKAWNTHAEGEIYKEAHPVEFQEWKWATKEVHDAEVKMRGTRANMSTRIRMAHKFSKEIAIYYPHSMDFRGRLYPIPSVGGMNPQGDDTGKALLEFAEGKALGVRGLFWLMVHGANCYGYDKDTFEGRVQWIKDHHDLIIDSAVNPMDGQRFWAGAKVDSPYCFLAFCFEYAKGWNNVDHISHLPIAMDGSCNGLQQFSALLRDNIGGAEVNLVPQEKPADIYSKVAQVVSGRVVTEALEGDEMAKLWVGKIDRKMAKRNVMTMPYGAKKFGFKDQLVAELKDRPKDYLDTDKHFKPAIYLADRMYTGIGQVVIAAREAMDWLQAVASVSNKAGVSLVWTTPLGFPAFQDYVVADLKRIWTFWGEISLRQELRLSIKIDTNKMDKRRNVNSVAPNYIHSLDSCHLQMSVLRMKEKGINCMAMIHDSYGTLAADVDIMNEELREAFIEMYTPDLLENFREEILKQIPEEFREQVPPVPLKGALDLNEVRNSRYFFA